MRVVKKCICEICGKEISASNIGKHFKRHKENPESFTKGKYKLNHEGLDCQFCGKTCKNRNSLCNHERQCKQNPNRQMFSSFISFNTYRAQGLVTTWNKGLTKETDERVLNISKKLTGKTSHVMSEEVKRKISQKIKLAYAEGRLGTRLHRLKHDRNYYGTYKGIECDSSYELAFVMYNIDHNIPFTRNTDYFEYLYNDKVCKYFPDFIIKGAYIEIKGRITDKDRAKWSQFPQNKNLVIIDSKAIQFYINYCKDNYGVDFIKLYDIDKPSWLNKNYLNK